MRFISPVFLRRCEIWPIRLALYKQISPISVSVARHGLLTFTPVHVTKVKGPLFDTPYSETFMNNVEWPDDVIYKAPKEGYMFPYVLTEEGDYDYEASEQNMKRYLNTQIVGSIYVPGELKKGDVILLNEGFTPLPPRQSGSATPGSLGGNPSL
jgi:hypothetical protein